MHLPRVGLLAIGNELLNGEVRDKNLFTLSKALTQLGFIVEQAAIVRDDPDHIAALLHRLLAENLSVLIISGGLGPTQDDLTLAALAQALALPMVENPEARQMVEQQYERLVHSALVPQRGPEDACHKMATLPQGATPLYNPIGTAPGVRLEQKQTIIYCLPGVPAELEAIFVNTIEEELRQLFPLGTWAEGALLAYCDDEAVVAHPLREVSARHPDVYLKSLARPFPAAHTEGLRIIATALDVDKSEAEAHVSRALTDLRQHLTKLGIPVKSL